MSGRLARVLGRNVRGRSARLLGCGRQPGSIPHLRRILMQAIGLLVCLMTTVGTASEPVPSGDSGYYISSLDHAFIPPPLVADEVVEMPMSATSNLGPSSLVKCIESSKCAPHRIDRTTQPVARAGFPWCISRFARCGVNPREYSAGYVGGGSGKLLGEARCIDEGTWGVDYDGLFFRKKIWKQWSHGRRYQGGTGAYKTDGPKIAHAGRRH
jgi:hypothetical protein